MAHINMKQFCDEISKDYAELLKNTLDEQEFDVVKRYVKRKHKILDLCCGTGRYLVALTKSGFQVDGIDFSTGMLEQAKEYAGQEKVNISIEQGDATSINRRNASYDVVLLLGDSLGSIPGIAHRKKAIDETYRILKPHGILICMVGHRNADITFFLQHITQYIFNLLNPRFTYGDRIYEFLGSQAIHHDYSKKEIEASFHSSGYTIVESIAGEGDLSYKLIYVCRK